MNVELGDSKTLSGEYSSWIHTLQAQSFGSIPELWCYANPYR